MTPRTLLAAGLGAAVIALAGCGAAASDSAPVATPAEKVAAADVAPAVTVPATTAAPTTTVDPETEIRQALDAYWAGYQACGESPATCDISYLAEQGPIRELALSGFGDMTNRGWYFSTDRRGSYYVVLSVSVSGQRATAVSCVFDAGIVLGAPGPDGQPTVVNDAEQSIEMTHELYQELGGWRVGQETTSAVLGDGDRCAG